MSKKSERISKRKNKELFKNEKKTRSKAKRMAEIKNTEDFYATDNDQDENVREPVVSRDSDRKRIRSGSFSSNRSKSPVNEFNLISPRKKSKFSEQRDRIDKEDHEL